MSAITVVSNLPQDEVQNIQAITERHLRAAGLYGTLPTPISDLMTDLKIRQDDDLDEFVSAQIASLSSSDVQVRARQTGWKKIKGMADLDRRSIYRPPLKSAHQDNWRDAHELSHLTLKWHKLHEGTIYHDCSQILNQQTVDRLECEANCGASGYIYQPHLFNSEVNDLPLNFESIIALSERYGGSIKATFLNAVKARLDQCVGITYLKNDWSGLQDGLPIFHKPLAVMSPSFAQRNYPWIAPAKCRTDWLNAYIENACVQGEALLPIGDAHFLFEWSAFWNTYDLMVLLKLRRSSFQVAVSEALKPIYSQVVPLQPKILTS